MFVLKNIKKFFKKNKRKTNEKMEKKIREIAPICLTASSSFYDNYVLQN